MLPDTIREKLQGHISQVEHPRELAIDVINALQEHFGYFSDEAVEQASELLGMTALELEELATFYTFIYREPVGKYVIHVCDSLICWMEGEENLLRHLLDKLDIELGGTSEDGLFTVLPVCCIGYCDRAPAILVNRSVYGPLNIESMDQLIAKLRGSAS
jgi:NADH-quinone oxidoreductase subunit E